MARTPHTDPYATLLEVLKEVRKESGTTQSDMAKRLKRPQSFVSKVETGERRLDFVELVAIARAMRVDPQDLFSKILKRLPKAFDL